MDSGSGLSGHTSGLIFRGRVPHESAVSVRGSDGLFQYAWLIRKEVDGFLVDFRCGPERMQIVPFGTVYRLEGVFSAWYVPEHDEIKKCSIVTMLKENDRVEVLLQSALDEPWRWHPGTLVAADFQNGVFGHVILSSPKTRIGAVIVPGQQIRRRLDESQLEHSQINNTDPVNGVVHYPLSLDFCVNHAPRELLAEVFDCLSTDQHTRMRRVCALWEDVIVATSGLIVNLPYQLSEPCYWHSLWKPTTRALMVEIRSLPVMAVARLLKRIKKEYGYPQLTGVGLRGVVIYERNFNSFCERLSDLRDELALFESTCRFIKLINPKLECYRSSDYSMLQCEVVAQNKWIDVSAPGFSDRFRTSLSVHYNPDIEGETPDVKMHNPVQDFISTKAVHPGCDRLMDWNTKHSGIPLASFFGRGSTVAIRGDDGLLQYALAVAKDNNGLLVDFRDRKPFVFVQFNKIYHYPHNNLRQKSLELNEAVKVLLRLKPDEPWRYHPASVCAITGSPFVNRLLGFVRVSVATGTTVTAVVPYRQIGSSYDPAELGKLLLPNGDRVWVDVRRRLDWEMKVNDLPSSMLQEVFGSLGVVECCRLRAVCKTWTLSAASVTFNTVYLEEGAQSSVTCLSNVWHKNVNTVVIESMGNDFWAVCQLLHRFMIQSGSAPLKLLVVKQYNDLPVTYTVGAGISDELQFLASVCRSLVFRKTSFPLRFKLGCFDLNSEDEMEEAYIMVQVKSGQIDLSTADYAAQLARMIAHNVEPRKDRTDKIRAYFNQPHRSSKCVNGVLKVLEDVDNVMREGADNRTSSCSVEHLLTLQPEKLNGLVQAAAAQLIDKYVSKR